MRGRDLGNGINRERVVNEFAAVDVAVEASMVHVVGEVVRFAFHADGVGWV